MFLVRGRSIITNGGTGNLSIEPYENIFPDVLKVCGNKDTNGNYIFPSNVYNYVIKIQNLTSQSKLIPVETGQFRLINNSTIERLNVNTTFNNGNYNNDDIGVITPLNVPTNAIIEVIGYNLNDNIKTTLLTSDIIALSDSKIYTNDTNINYTVTVSSTLQLDNLILQQLSTGTVTLLSGENVTFLSDKTGEIITSLSTSRPGQQLMLFKTGIENIYVIVDTDINSTLIDSIIENLDNKVDKITGKGLSTNDYTDAEKNKLSGIANNATANDTDANLKNRSNHNGTQPIDTIDGLQTILDNINTTIEQNNGGFRFIEDEFETVLKNDKRLSSISNIDIKLTINKDLIIDLDVQQLNTGNIELIAGPDVFLIGQSLSTNGIYNQLMIRKTAFANTYIVTRIGGDMIWNGIENIVPFDNGTTIFDNGSTIFIS